MNQDLYDPKDDPEDGRIVTVKLAVTPFPVNISSQALPFHFNKIPPLIYTSPSDTPSMGTQIPNKLLHYTNKMLNTALYTSRSVLSWHILFYRGELDLSHLTEANLKT
jgi:hypothetical protein